MRNKCSLLQLLYFFWSAYFSQNVDLCDINHYMSASPVGEPDEWLIQWGSGHVNKWKFLLIKASTTPLKCQLFDFCRLSFCKVTGDGCASLASALRSEHCSLRELDLSFNHLTDQGVELLTEIQRDSRCSLEKLKYADAFLSFVEFSSFVVHM